MIGLKNAAGGVLSKETTKAYLKNSDGFCFPLPVRQTLIGREACDILIQITTVDPQHAMVEFNEVEDCYVLTDLNTINGTFVNDVRIHNAAVRLAPRDIIRFGAKGTPYEFYISNNGQMTSTRPSFKRSAWGQQIRLSSPNPQGPSITAPTLPQLMPLSSTQDQSGSIMAWAPSITGTVFTSHAASNCSTGICIASSSNSNTTNVTGHTQAPLPQHPDQVRPAANGHPQRINWERPSSAQPVYPDSALDSNTNNWVSNFFPPSKSRENGSSNVLNKSYTIMSSGDAILEEKDKKIASLVGEVDRLKSVGEELQREQELRTQLEEELKKLKTDSSLPDSTTDPLKDEIVDKTNQLINLQNELDKTKKDKNITVGLITQMQKDLSNKDSTISRLSREVENLKRNLWEQESSIESLNTKLSKMREGVKNFEENENRERELANVCQQLRSLEVNKKEKEDYIKSQNEEINKLKQNLSEEREAKRKLQADLGQVRFELDDITRAERMVRVDMEQIKNKMERFQNRVVQVAFSIPGIVPPEKELNDDELLDILKNMAEAKEKLNETIENYEEKLKKVENEKKDLISKSNQLSSEVLDFLTRLESKGLQCTVLKEEMELFESVRVEAPLSWIKDHFLKLLKTQMNWQEKTEASLEKCGINIKLSTGETSEHINWLQNKWSVALEENQQLKKRITKNDEDHKNEIQVAFEKKEEETVERIKEAVERAVLQGKENLSKAIEEMQNLETEKQENILKKEKEKVKELNNAIDKLKQLLNKKDTEMQEKLDEANKVLTEMEELKVSTCHLEAKLRETNEKIQFEADQNGFQIQTIKNKHKQEMLSYKEQIKQHSITICALEEKLAKTTKAHKKSVEQVTTLEKKLHESRTHLPTKQPQPPRPKVVVQDLSSDLQARDQQIAILRKEVLEVKQQLQNKEEVIISLRKDLLGTSARLSDIKGEFCEESKKKLEHNKHSMNMQQREMNGLRQRLASLSQMIEEKKERIKRLQTELEQEKGANSSYKKSNKELSEKISILQRFMDQEKDDRQKIEEFNQRENNYSTELANLGAQCRGERHDQVISRQREALSELRQKVKTLETGRFQSGANKLFCPAFRRFPESNEILSFDKNNSSLNSLSGNKPQRPGSNPEAEIERSAHKETADALETSEISFLFFLRQLLTSFNVEDKTGLQSLAHISSDERQTVLQARKQTCENLMKEIKSQQSRFNQKEKLLKDYEEDLAKMRKAEDLASKMTQETDLLAKDLINKTEETELLRESLNRTTSQLHQEKRLNTAIKQKKTFHLENERAHIGVQSSPHFCAKEKSISKLGIEPRNTLRRLVNSKDPYAKPVKKETSTPKSKFDQKFSCYSESRHFLPATKPHHSDKT